MTKSLEFWIIIGGCVLFLGLIFIPLLMKKYLRQRKEARRIWKEKQRELREIEKKEADERKALRERKLKELGAYRIAVFIRTLKWGKTAFEGTLIRELLQNGLEVISIPEETLKNIAQGDTSSLKPGTAVIYGFFNSYVSDYWDRHRRYSCDYRMIRDREPDGLIIGIGYADEKSEYDLAQVIVDDLVLNLPVQKSQEKESIPA